MHLVKLDVVCNHEENCKLGGGLVPLTMLTLIAPSYKIVITTQLKLCLATTQLQVGGDYSYFINL